MSEKDLSAATGLSVPLIRQALGGIHSPTRPVAEKILRALDLDPEPTAPARSHEEPEEAALELPISTGKGLYHPAAPGALFAVMSYPNPSDERQGTLLDLTNCDYLLADSSTEAETLQRIALERLPTILFAPPLTEALEKAAAHANLAWIAGEALLWILTIGEHHLTSNLSPTRIISRLERIHFLVEDTTGIVSPLKTSTVWAAWSTFKPVAHLYAAGQLAGREVPPASREDGFKELHWHLSLAEVLRRRGIGAGILDHNETWAVPADLKSSLLELDFELLPLESELVERLSEKTPPPPYQPEPVPARDASPPAGDQPSSEAGEAQLVTEAAQLNQFELLSPTLLITDGEGSASLDYILPITDGAGGLYTHAAAVITARMLRPEPADFRQDLLTVAGFANLILAGEGLFEKALGLEWAPSLAAALLEAPAVNQQTVKASAHAGQAWLAGEILLTHLSALTHHPELQLSITRIFRNAHRLWGYDTAKGFEELKKSSGRTAWAQFKSVAHLHAAAELMSTEPQLVEPVGDLKEWFPRRDLHVVQFLSISERLLRYASERQVLSIRESWRCPPDLELEQVELHVPPLEPEVLAVLTG